MSENAPGGNVDEVFSSIQGEGLHVGRQQIFVRFRGCNLACRYCDTPAAQASAGDCSVETAPGQPPRAEPNPIPPQRLAQIIADVDRCAGPHHSISLTGGEPLLQTPFLLHALPLIRQAGLPIYLETNGTLPDELDRLIDLVDIVAMDIKVPSATGQPARLDANRRFLAVAVRKDTFVKIVFTERMTDAELGEICSAIQSAQRPVSVVLQPVTPRDGVVAPSAAMILEIHRQFAARLPDVRVIPQIHPLLGLR